MPWIFLDKSIPSCVLNGQDLDYTCAYAIWDTSCVFDANQKGRLMAATTDMVNTLFAMGRMGWCFALW
ncbi:hypothetical protein K492DRAFT_36990 [Lichtheimia hyalospora FSU 10163]|nr:hypothetical protein K492DRAFT_36990 [Lichtheimia hyalospora FSU 10163]